MKNVSATLTVVILSLFLPWLVYSQEAEAPTYKEGDWWQVKVEYKFEKGVFDRSQRCNDKFSEYLVVINQGTPNVYGLRGTKKKAIDCLWITEHLLNNPDRLMLLKFPLKVNKNWSHRFQNRQDKWLDSETNVVSSEKVRTPKAEFDAFKIEWVFSGRRGDITQLYYYSPKAKAIVLLTVDRPRAWRKITLVDFNVK